MDGTAVVFDTGDELVYFIVEEDWERFAGVDLADEDIPNAIREDFKRCVYSGDAKRYRHEPVGHAVFHEASVGGMNVIVCGDSA